MCCFIVAEVRKPLEEEKDDDILIEDEPKHSGANKRGRRQRSRSRPNTQQLKRDPKDKTGFTRGKWKRIFWEHANEGTNGLGADELLGMLQKYAEDMDADAEAEKLLDAADALELCTGDHGTICEADFLELVAGCDSGQKWKHVLWYRFHEDIVLWHKSNCNSSSEHSGKTVANKINADIRDMLEKQEKRRDAKQQLCGWAIFWFFGLCIWQLTVYALVADKLHSLDCFDFLWKKPHPGCAQLGYMVASLPICWGLWELFAIVAVLQLLFC
jgi:hypothetical protein